MGTPVGAVQAANPQKGVKRSAPGQPTHVPGQLPGFRGRSVDAGAAVKAPKLRNGNLNNETSNVRIPYSRVCPLEFLSSYQGRLGPGDVLFTYKFPPGFLTARADFNNATLGVNTLSRVVGLDGLNRLLMQSGPNGWRLEENVFEAPTGGNAIDVFGADGTCQLSVLRDYHLDGVVISNDEPGAFTSSGSRDNALFNIAIQGPVETNNGFLMYEDEQSSRAPLGPDKRRYDAQYNPLTGTINARTVEAHARGSAESGMHIENQPLPGRIGNQFANSQGKIDFVANYCGTYSQFPSQMFDRRVEILNTLYLGLRAYELSTEAKLQVTDANGSRRFGSEEEAEEARVYFYQYMPFSSRAAAVIQEVSDKHNEMLAEARRNGVEAPSRAQAASLVKAVKQQTATHLPSATFDAATYDPIRSEDLWAMCGAWRVGRVMDTKAAVHDRYAGGPRDTAFSCIVDVGIAWGTVLPIRWGSEQRSHPTGFLLPPSEGGYVPTYEKDGDGNDDRNRPIPNPKQEQRSGQQDATCLANNHAPPLTSTIGNDVGRNVLGAPPPRAPAVEGDAGLQGEKKKRGRKREKLKQAKRVADQRAATEARRVAEQGKRGVAFTEEDAAQADAAVREAIQQVGLAKQFFADEQFGQDPMAWVLSVVASSSPDTDQNVYSLRAEDRARFGGGETQAAWEAFQAAKEGYIGLYKAEDGDKKKLGGLLANVNRTTEEWKQRSAAELKSVNASAIKFFTPAEFNAYRVTLSERIGRFLESFEGAKSKIEALVGDGASDATATARISQRNKFLNRANLYVYLFRALMKAMGAWSTRAVVELANDELATDQDLENAMLSDRLVHFSALCDLHEERFPSHKPLVPQAAPVAATPAATGAKPPATPAATGAKPPAKPRGKSPARPRPTPTGAAAVPAAAAGVSATPLVPTASGTSAIAAPLTAAVDAAPRRRARETGESVTNSLFANMFSAPPMAESATEAPASPTPSSGSEGPSSGPRTFRRQR